MTRLRLPLVGLAACLAALCGGIAHAQLPSRSQIRPQQHGGVRADVARSDVLFRRTIACVVDRWPDRAAGLPATIPGSTAEFSIMSDFQPRLNWCFDAGDSGIRFSSSVLRGGIAEIYYHRSNPGGLPRGPRMVDAAQAAAWTRPRAVDRGDGGLEALHSVARCVVLRQPGLVSDLLATTPLSAEESAATRALQNDLSACLTAGVTFTASRQSLRGLLAEAALHYGEVFGAGFGPASASPVGAH